MADRLKIGVSAEVDGFVTGMDKAAKSAEKYEQEVQNIVDSGTSLRKELRQSRNEANDLALAYSKLSKEAQNSKAGQELRAQMEQAAQKTAELRDLTDDLQEKYKNLADDNRWFNTAKDGFELIANSALGFVGTLATITGNEEDANRAMSALAATTGLLGTATKIQTALQKQSNIMLAIGTVQEKAKAAADKIAARSTGELTIAQRAFNLVAKANPYILLASALVGVIGALGTYLAITHKSKDAQEEEKKATERRQAANDAMSKSLEETIPLYTRLQTEWKNLKTEGEKTEWIKENEKYFHQLGVEITSTGDAENFLVTNTEAVKQAFIERAKASAAAAEAVEVYRQEMEAVNNAESGKRVSMKEALDMGLDRKDVATNSKYHHGWFGKDTYELTAEQITQARQNAIKKAQERIGKLYDDMSASEKKAADKIAEAGVKAYVEAEKKRQKAIKNSNKDAIKYAIGSLGELEAQLSKLQSDRKNGFAPNIDKDEYIRQVDDLLRRIKEKKIELGLEKPETVKEKLQRQLEEARVKYELAIDSNDEQARQAALEVYKQAKKVLEEHEIKLTIELGLSEADKTRIQNEIDDIVNKALNPEQETKYDFSSLSDGMKEEADKVLEEYNRIKDAKDELTRKMQEATDDTTIARAQDALDKLSPSLSEATAKLNEYQAAADQRKADQLKAEDITKKSEALGSYADMLRSTASGLDALGDSEEAQAAQFALNTAATIVSAIQQIAAMQAQALAAGTASGAALPFPANIAAIATIVGTIASIFASLPKFAEGGIINGHSYIGDKLLARVNSKEAVLNERQQERALELMDNNVSYVYNNAVRVTGVIKGTDIYLTQKNVEKLLSKSGKNIKIQ